MAKVIRGMTVVRRVRPYQSVTIQGGVRTFRTCEQGYIPNHILLKVTTTNIKNPTYQWKELQGDSWVSINGATSVDFSVVPSDDWDSRTFGVEVQGDDMHPQPTLFDYTTITVLRNGIGGNSYLEEVIKKGTTNINGGLVLTNVLGVKDLQGKVQAGINGQQSENNDIRFWAGSTFQNIQNAPFKVYENGMIDLQNIKEGKEISLKNEELKNLDYYTADNGIQTIPEKIGDYFEKTVAKSIDYNSETNITQDDFETGNKIERIKITDFDLQQTSRVQTRIEVSVCIPRDENFDAIARVVDRDTGEIVEIGEVSTKAENISWKKEAYLYFDKVLPAGKYRIEARACVYYKRDYYVRDVDYSATWEILRVNSAIREVTISSEVNKLYLYSDGILCIDEQGKYFYLKQGLEDYLLQMSGGLKCTGKTQLQSPNNENNFQLDDDGLTYTGKTDIPGILASGSSDESGTLSRIFGKIDYVQKIIGGYRIYHKVGHSNFSVQITPHLLGVGQRNNDGFNIGAVGDVAIDIFGYGGFDFVFIGHNT